MNATTKQDSRLPVPSKSSASPDTDRGILKDNMCRILIKVLWAARLARCDLLRAVNFLAMKVTKWTNACDLMLQSLMEENGSAKHLRRIGWVGDSAANLCPNVCASGAWCASGL